MPGQFHESLIAMIVGLDPRIKRTRWRAELRAAVGDYGDLEIAQRRPDAFLVDPDQERATVWEVEINAPLSLQRLEEWARLWADLDSRDWELVLFTVDRLGQFHQANLQTLYYALLHRRRRAARRSR